MRPDTDQERKAWWARTVDELLQEHGVDPGEGLTSEKAARLLSSHGPNRLKKTATRSTMAIFLDQWANLIVALLGAAAVTTFVFGQWLEAVSVLIALLINVLIGFFTELKATRSMEALRRMSRVTAKVLRNGDVKRIPAARLVPGDIVVLDGGDVVPADLRLVEANRLRVDEAALTGESVPVAKSVEPADPEADISSRSSALYKGTALTGGSGKGLVAATGMDTELGRISSLTEEAEAEQTPLEKRLNQLGQKLIYLTLGVAALVATAGLFTHLQPLLILETAIALAVAAIPEGLPIVATIALARGMWRMSRRNAVMNNLASVETLGATTLICSDKTGTLTRNRMHVTSLALAGDTPAEQVLADVAPQEGFLLDGEPLDPDRRDDLHRLLLTGVLCNNAYLPAADDAGEEPIGDPLEAALLEVGRLAGIKRPDLLESMVEEREHAFDPERKMMATVHRGSTETQGYFVAVKGAADPVLAASSRTPAGDLDQDARNAWLRRNESLAAQGLRVLALAWKPVDDPDARPYEDLEFLGLAAMHDPPRQGVRDAVGDMHQAGIRVVMITGDHPATALNIARDLGLASQEDEAVLGSEVGDPGRMSEEARQRMLATPVFARIAPEAKLSLIQMFQDHGHVVAMTGDGVNDAPALKKADIGVAMGGRGTQVAREASDVVLTDDAFGTIALAIEQGRNIFANIRKFIVYLLSGNIGEILIVGAAILAGLPLPLLPLQILYLNMLSDVFPALALGVGRGDPAVMDRPPRPSFEPIVTWAMWGVIFAYGLVLATCSLGAFVAADLWLGLAGDDRVTVSFLTLAFGRLWHVFNMRDSRSRLLVNEVTTNLLVWGALALCAGLLLLGAWLPGLSDVLSLTAPTLRAWALILGASAAPMVLVQPFKFAAGRRGR